MYAHDHSHDSACDHCQKPQRELLAHLIPRTLRQEANGQELGRAFVILRLCQVCAGQRQQDLRSFIAGAAPTTLVSPGASR